MNTIPATRGPRSVRAGGEVRRNALVFALLAPLLGACSSTGGGAKNNEDAGDPSADTYGPTFTAIYGEVLVKSCRLSFCHDGNINPMPLIDQASSYKQIVNVAASGPLCGNMGLVRVVPGDPTMSLFYQKVVQPVPVCGNPMPGMAVGALTARKIAQIESWIMMGAKND
jgi:hypothetical protein